MKKVLFVLLSILIFTGCNSKLPENLESTPETTETTSAVISATTAETVTEAVTEKITAEITTESLDYVLFQYELTDNGLNVYKILNRMGETGELHQQLEVEIETRSDNIKEIVIPYDYDFDGYGDIAVRTYLGATNAVYRYFHYNPDTDLFENWSELDDLHFFVRTNADKTLSVDSKSSAVDWEDTAYKWAGDVLIPISMKKRYWNDKGIFMDYFEYDEEGNETLIRREKQVYDENGNLISITDVTP